jgi:hypothetical protein
MDLVNEKELGESIATNLGPKIEIAQSRLENWVDNLILRLAAGYAVKIQVPFGDRIVAVTVELVPKP